MTITNHAPQPVVKKLIVFPSWIEIGKTFLRLGANNGIIEIKVPINILIKNLTPLFLYDPDYVPSFEIKYGHIKNDGKKLLEFNATDMISTYKETPFNSVHLTFTNNTSALQIILPSSLFYYVYLGTKILENKNRVHITIKSQGFLSRTYFIKIDGIGGKI